MRSFFSESQGRYIFWIVRGRHRQHTSYHFVCISSVNTSCIPLHPETIEVSFPDSDSELATNTTHNTANVATTSKGLTDFRYTFSVSPD
jgi:hypothetical protein